MDLQNVELFKDISHDSVDSMMKCFSPEVR